MPMSLFQNWLQTCLQWGYVMSFVGPQQFCFGRPIPSQKICRNLCFISVGVIMKLSILAWGDGKVLPWQACEPEFESLECIYSWTRQHSSGIPVLVVRQQNSWKLVARQPTTHRVSRDPVSNKVEGKDRHPRLSSDFTCNTHTNTYMDTHYTYQHTHHTYTKNEYIKTLSLQKKHYYHYCFKRI